MQESFLHRVGPPIIAPASGVFHRQPKPIKALGKGARFQSVFIVCCMALHRGDHFGARLWGVGGAREKGGVWAQERGASKCGYHGAVF